LAQKFITTRELGLIRFWTKELVQEVSRQYVLYYAVSADDSVVHDVYDEGVTKTLLDPVKVSCRVEYDESAATTGNGVMDSNFELTVQIQPQELVERNLNPRSGDFVEWGQVMFEVTNVKKRNPAYGQANEKVTIELTCYPSREGQYKAENSSEDGIDNTHPAEPARPRTLGDDL
jgi:hypothetical protein